MSSGPMKPSSHLPPKPPDPSAQFAKPFHQATLGDDHPSSDGDELIDDAIAAELKAMEESRRKVDALQKRKRAKPASVQTSTSGDFTADDSDQSSHRPNKVTKVNQNAVTDNPSAEGSFSIENDDHKAAYHQQLGDGPSLVLPSRSLPLSGHPSSKHRARVSLDDPTSSTDRARVVRRSELETIPDLIVTASKHPSGGHNGPDGVAYLDPRKSWKTPLEILAKGLGINIPQDGKPTEPRRSSPQPVRSPRPKAHQTNNDEDEEKQVQSELAPHKGPQSRKRGLSSETESTLQGDIQDQKRARLLEPNTAATVVPHAKSPRLTSPHHASTTLPAKPATTTPTLALTPLTPSLPALLSPRLTSAHESVETGGPSDRATERPVEKLKALAVSRSQEPSQRALGGGGKCDSHVAVASKDANDASELGRPSSSERINAQVPLPSEDHEEDSPDERSATPDPEESDDPEKYGEPKSAKGRYATQFYPGRLNELKVPSGALSDRRRKIRYDGKTVEEVESLCDADKKAEQALPKYARGQIKGIKRAYFDAEVHLWLAPRIYNLSRLEDHSSTKGTLQATVIRELFERFPDLHPNNLYLRNSTMEDAYINKIKSSLTSHTSTLKKKATSNNHPSARFGPVLLKSLGKVASPRPVDLWFRDPDVKLCLGGWWTEENQKVVDKCAPDVVRKTWISRYTSWRKRAFARLPLDVREYYQEWAEELKNEPESMDPEQLILHGIPFVQSWLHEFSVKTGIPFMLILSTQNAENPTQIDTYCQTGRGNAPSDIPDFKNMENDWVMKNFIPRWRASAEKAFVGHDSGAADLTFELIDSALVDVQVEEPVRNGPEQVEGFNNPDDLPTQARMREVVLSRIKESWMRGYGSSRVDYKKASLSEHLAPERRPRIMETFDMETTDGRGATILKTVTHTVVAPLKSPNDMGGRELKAWFRHVTDPGVPPDNRFAFQGELAKLAARVTTVPTTIQKALILSDDSVGDVGNTSSDDERTVSRIIKQKRKKKVKAKVSSKPVTRHTDEEPEAIESNAPTSAGDEYSIHESDDGPTSSEGDHDSDGVPQNRAAKASKTRSKRLSLPPNREQPESGGLKTRASATARKSKASVPSMKLDNAEASPQPANTPGRKEFIKPVPSPFIFLGSREGEDVPQGILHVPSLSRRIDAIKSLPEPDVLSKCPPDCRSVQTLFSSLLHIEHIFPNLPELVVSLLPHGFSKHVGSPQYQKSMALLFEDLNDIDMPVPKMLELFKNCEDSTELVQYSFDIMSSFIDGALDKLSSSQMPMRTANVFGIIARFLDFLRRAPSNFQDVRPSPTSIAAWFDRLALAGWRGLVLTYTMATARSFLSLHCSAAPLDLPPTINISNSIQVLTNWWYLSLRRIAHDPSWVLDMLDFLPTQWKPSLAKSPPCIQLSAFDRRWYRASYTPGLGEQVERYLEVTLKQNLSSFEGISILDQMQVLTSVFTVHEYKCNHEQGLEEAWLPYLDRLVNVIKISCAEAGKDDNVLHDVAKSLDYDNEIPPEKPPRRAAPRRKAKGADSVHAWAIGDIAEITHNKRKLKIQVVEQDDRLSMVNFKTRMILKDKQGIPYALPDPGLTKILEFGTIIDRTNSDLHRLPSILPPKPDWRKPETYAYDVVLSDDERAEAALAAEANKPVPAIVDPELDAHVQHPTDGSVLPEQRTDVGAHQGPKDALDLATAAKLEQGGGQEDAVVVTEMSHSESGPTGGAASGHLEGAVGKGGATADGVEDPKDMPEQRTEQSMHKKMPYIKERSSARVTRSQDTQEDTAPDSRQGIQAASAPSAKKSAPGGSKAKNAPKAKVVRIQSPERSTRSKAAKQAATPKKTQANETAGSTRSSMARTTRASNSNKQS
ncbi:hypothetical protein FRC00_005000 [Tulasnella sp. 408]|nr:hypothetical protein FRC00_005000 [Tulasnella sp. 408]